MIDDARVGEIAFREGFVAEDLIDEFVRKGGTVSGEIFERRGGRLHVGRGEVRKEAGERIGRREAVSSKNEQISFICCASRAPVGLT